MAEWEMENVKAEKADEELLAQHGMSEQPFWVILKTTGEVDRSISVREVTSWDSDAPGEAGSSFGELIKSTWEGL